MSDDAPEPAAYYGCYYSNFGNAAYAEIRTAEFGEDLGQNNWQTPAERERFASQLELAAGVRLLDVACGTGGLSVHLARTTGCDVTGVDLEESGLENGRRIAREAGIEAWALYVRADASRPLPFADGSFDAVLCIDALNQLPGRAAVFAEWARLLAPAPRPAIYVGKLLGIVLLLVVAEALLVPLIALLFQAALFTRPLLPC